MLRTTVMRAGQAHTYIQPNAFVRSMEYHYIAGNPKRETLDDLQEWVDENARQHGCGDIIKGSNLGLSEDQKRIWKIIATVEDPILFHQKFAEYKTYFRNKRLKRCNITKPNGYFDNLIAAKAAVEIVDLYLRCTASTFGKFKQYLAEDFWKDIFEKQISCWDKTSYDSSDMSKLPSDTIIFMVFYHTFGWREKFNHFLMNGEHDIAEKKKLFHKIMLNIAFFLHGSVSGSQWHMYSTPDTCLTQALGGNGRSVQIVDENNEPLKTITQRKIYASVSGAIDSPDLSPDALDKKIYNGVSEFTKSKGIDVKNEYWTLVRASFYTGGKEIRCYAFSGNAKSTRDYHETPIQWWRGNKTKSDFWSDNREIFICNIDKRQIFQNMILKIFDTLRSNIERDLKKLAHFLSIDDLYPAEHIVHGGTYQAGPGNTLTLGMEKQRFDLGTLDYGEFYDIVTHKLNDYDESIIKITSNIIKGSGINVESIKNFIRICKDNQQYEPVKEELEKLQGLTPEKTKKLIDLCVRKLKKLEEEIKGLPQKFLDELRKIIETSHCGEDNVLHLLLEKYMANVDVYTLSPVKFISLDKNTMEDGKPFCQVCNRKVRFFNIIPYFIFELGMEANLNGNIDVLN